MRSDKIYNVHAHIFNFDCVPDGFLSNYLPEFVARLLAWLIRNGLGKPLVRLLRRFPMTSKYVTFLIIGIHKDQEETFDELSSAYPAGSRIVILPMDFDYMGGGYCPNNNDTQLTLLDKVKLHNPDTCLPFLSLDPRRGTAQENLDFVKYYFSTIHYKGYIGIKLYPALGFYPFDPRLELVYEFAAANNIPITTHCTRYGAFYIGKTFTPGMTSPVSFNRTPETEMLYNDPANQYKPGMKNGEFCDMYLHPKNYYDVLEKFPTLKLNIAHFGGDEEILLELDKNKQNSWYWYTREMMMATNAAGQKKFPNLYTDISFSYHNDKIVNNLKLDLANTALRDRILFGTDFFMTAQYGDEAKMVAHFREKLDDEAMWSQMTVTNPVSFLSSTFYTAGKP
jgi:predicted TIM-barrel fold metal-dependent hydrolase